jgi:hypothetical protein
MIIRGFQGTFPDLKALGLAKECKAAVGLIQRAARLRGEENAASRRVAELRSEGEYQAQQAENARVQALMDGKDEPEPLELDRVQKAIAKAEQRVSDARKASELTKRDVAALLAEQREAYGGAALERVARLDAEKAELLRKLQECEAQGDAYRGVYVWANKADAAWQYRPLGADDFDWRILTREASPEHDAALLGSSGTGFAS